MHTIPPKKMTIINILNILKKYSDSEHRLTQQDIAKLLEKEYSMVVDRKTIKRNLMNLLDLDYDFEYTETTKLVKKKDKNGKEVIEEVPVFTDWYIQREFDDSEIRLLIDSVLFSKSIPHSQCRQLIEKLVGLSNIYFSRKVGHICNLPENQPENKELFYTIDVLEEAISHGKKVAFIYNRYGADKKLHPRSEEEYVISPYQMVATNGRYYVICNYEKYGGTSNFRIDKIKGIRMLDEARKELRDVQGAEMNLPKHMAEHLYMFGGESIRAKFKAKNHLIDQIIDWYGNDVTIRELEDDECLVEVTVNREAFFCWAMQYGLHIEVMEPVDMRERIIDSIKKMSEIYQ